MDNSHNLDKYCLFLHVCNLHIDLVLLLCLVPLQQNYEFEFWGAVLCQDLVARVGHLILEFPVVECDQCVFDHGALSWSGKEIRIRKLSMYRSVVIFSYEKYEFFSFKCFHLHEPW